MLSCRGIQRTLCTYCCSHWLWCSHRNVVGYQISNQGNYSEQSLGRVHQNLNTCVTAPVLSPWQAKEHTPQSGIFLLNCVFLKMANLWPKDHWTDHTDLIDFLTPIRHVSFPHTFKCFICMMLSGRDLNLDVSQLLNTSPLFPAICGIFNRYVA